MKSEKKMAHSLGWKILWIAFILGPALAGLDKLVNAAVSWSDYLAPQIAGWIPFSIGTIMVLVGIVELAAGLLVWWKPGTGGIAVGIWLSLVTINLLIGGFYADAFRDALLAAAAFSFGTMAMKK